MKVRVHYDEDGTIQGITWPVAKRYSGESDTDYLDRVSPAGLGEHVLDIDDSELPGREQRDSWVVVDGAVVEGA